MIMDESYKQELLEYIAETPDLIFEAYNHTRESVLQHIEELWTAYQKDVEEYECTADWDFNSKQRRSMEGIRTNKIRRTDDLC